MSVKSISPVQPKNVEPHRLLKPQLTAWLVLISCFAVFCLIAYSITSSVVDYFSNSVKPQSATALALPGAEVSVRHTGQDRFILVGQNQPESLNEGDILRTALNGSALLTLFDGSTVELSSNTELILTEQRIRTTNFVQKEKRLNLTLLHGVIKLKIEPLILQEYSRALVKATTPYNTEFLFNDFVKGNYPSGTYIIDLEGNGANRTWVTSQATNLQAIDVRADGKTASLLPGQRFIIERGAGPTLPEHGERELLNNGAFIDGFDFWKEQHDQGGDGGSVIGRALPDSELIDDGTITRAHILRYESSGNFEETS